MGILGLFSTLFRPKGKESGSPRVPVNLPSQVVTSEREPVGADGVTVTPIIRQVFDHVMTFVEIEPKVRESLFHAYSEAHQSGSPRAEERAVIDALANSGWRWSEFDAWAERFAAAKEWPYMWHRLKELSESQPSLPSSVPEAVARLGVSDMRALLSERGLIGRPVPRKRAEFEEIVVRNIRLQEIIERFKDYWGVSIKQWQCNQEIAKCKLLAHTLTMTCYSWGAASQRSQLSADKYPVKALLGTGCPVEEKYAKLFNVGKIRGLPPFFPGDRNSVISGVPGKEEY